MFGCFKLSAFSYQKSAVRRHIVCELLILIWISKSTVLRNFETLSFWQRSHSLTIKIYNITQSFPKEELFGLTSQMRRAASSIPTNIAEGCGRESIAELKRFLIIAAGSSSELQYQLILSKDLNFIDERLFKELVTEIIEIRKMIYSYYDKLKPDS